jgi:hypothetical protein
VEEVVGLGGMYLPYGFLQEDLAVVVPVALAVVDLEGLAVEVSAVVEQVGVGNTTLYHLYN